MRYIIKSILFFITVLFISPAVYSATDPIFLDEPSEKVFECGNNFFLEIIDQPTISKFVAARTAKDNYLFFTVEILYLSDQTWKGMDKTSFILRHQTDDEEEEFPLDYATTMILNRTKKSSLLSGTLEMPSLWTIGLVFNVTGNDPNNWSLIVTPKERGAEETLCSVTIPLSVR